MANDETKSTDPWEHLDDVPVPLSIELGRTKLTLAEVVEMKENTIIKLDRSTGEGIIVRAGDESLFKAEIIVIEDRAGIRINEIYSENRK